MEYQNHDATYVLKVDNVCCNAFRKKLKKDLSKVPGVNSVAIDPERSLVLVKGKVDPMLVKAIIAKLGKTAEVLSYDRQPRNNREHVEEQPKNMQSEFHKYPNDTRNTSCNCHKMEENYHKYQDHDHRPSHKMEENFHRCQDQVPPEVDEHICRDEHCKIHHPRNVYHDHMSSAGMYGHFSHGPFHGTSPRCHSYRGFHDHMPSAGMYGHFPHGPFPGINPRYHNYRGGHYPFRDDTYLHTPMMAPPAAHGFGSRRPMAAYDDLFTSFGHEDAGSCSIM